jgi:hypothetical protein
VPWPDDSTLHLIGALAGARPDRWLDVGTGPATAPLAWRRRGTAVRATDAPARPRLGPPRPGAGRVAPTSRWPRSTSSPAPAGWDLITHERADPARARRRRPGHRVARRRRRRGLARDAVGAGGRPGHAGGEVVVHAVDADDDRYATAGALGGALTVARYTPVDAPAFAIYRWRPHAPASRRRGAVVLGPGHPFVTAADLDAIAAADDRAGSDLR